ncbi:DUF6934 family protein [Dyadobacter pollutisoli]|jgi:hypothetical protein|uniref:Uncharacterized protein n=1 Tax=Dyadobacter pollutisoli TaxID=2910158 RepID=A0A9E8NA23_9BACT|nr:hypothetical protein [Dyadobacter pollutisoli]WAC12775.1 hypothetical protein ON006_02180 [Dyadobacter pollutisoli]
MNIEKYTTSKLDEYTYQFNSFGPKGIIELRVVISEFFGEDAYQGYNLAFGVWDDDLKVINDTADTRNGDMDQILATVAEIALVFLDSPSGGYIYAEGSNLARTRKYQMGISKYFSEIRAHFNVKGLIINSVQNESDRFEWEDIRSGKNYRAFALFKND